MPIFFYYVNGDNMKVYIDVILFINIFFDFLLLLSVSLILRRNAKLYRIVLGSLMGGLSILFLFLNISKVTLFFLKLIIAILMILITFSYKDLRYTLKNLVFLYISSIVLGGALYFINIEFSYKNKGIIFYNNGYSVNIITILITSPILIYLYIKNMKDIKNNYSKYYKTNIYFKSNHFIELTGYMDTGNNLTDPYKKRMIILVSKEKVSKYIKNERKLLVPYNGVSNGLLSCIRINYIKINDKIFKNVLLGLIDDKIYIDGADIILNNGMEDLCLEE